MPDFRNAYHFVPRLKPTPETLLELPKTQASFGLTPQTATFGHAVYAEGALSGRLRCRITLETPMVIGAGRLRQDRSHTIVEPFLFKGLPAVPATSIKGVISSVAEAASMAPFRVLENMKLTIRTGGRGSVRKSQGDPGVMMGRSHDYFAPDSLPSTMSRKTIHLVESMFGFVRMEGPGSRKQDKELVSVAGKLRFSHGCLPANPEPLNAADVLSDGEYSKDRGVLAGEISLTRLKEQAQPMKVPPNNSDLRSATPNFYFKRKSAPEQFIDKASYASQPPATFEPQGGKFYLHHPDGRTGEPWKTADRQRESRDLERKAAAAPIKAGTEFEFSVDFDNLTAREFELLCFALKPTPKFRHKIGLGKALGLGSIRIDILDCTLVDRAQRYRVENTFASDPRSVGTNISAVDAGKAAESHLRWLERNDPAALVALLAIGEIHAFDEANLEAKVPVLWVPLAESKFSAIGTPFAESKSYEWFTENDKAHAQKLEPIHRRDYIPMLGTRTRPKRNGDMSRPAPQPQPATGMAADITIPSSNRTTLQEGEIRGTLKFFKAGPDGAYFGFVIPHGGGKDVHIGQEAGMAAGLEKLPQNSKVAVAFTTKLDTQGKSTVATIRKF